MRAVMAGNIILDAEFVADAGWLAVILKFPVVLDIDDGVRWTMMEFIRHPRPAPP